jgi:hypothetical protein
VLKLVVKAFCGKLKKNLGGFLSQRSLRTRRGVKRLERNLANRKRQCLTQSSRRTQKGEDRTEFEALSTKSEASRNDQEDCLTQRFRDRRGLKRLKRNLEKDERHCLTDTGLTENRHQ